MAVPYSQQDTLISHSTQKQTIGISYGFFATPHIITQDAVEKPELVQISINSVDFYQPKRTASGDIGLNLLYSLEISGFPACFTVVHQKSTVLDDNKNKRMQIQSFLVVKTLDSTLYILGRKVISKIKLGQRYALPSPLVYHALQDTLIISTFEYEVVALNFSSLLEIQNQQLSQEENLQIKPLWSVCVNDRIQQLAAGRFFGADSDKNGEILTVLPRQLLWFNDSGQIWKELRFGDAQILNVASVYPADSGVGGKHSIIQSLLVLQAGGIVSIVHNGLVKWKGQFQSTQVGSLNLNLGQVSNDFQIDSISASNSSSQLVTNEAVQQEVIPKTSQEDKADVKPPKKKPLKSKKQDNSVKLSSNNLDQPLQILTSSCCTALFTGNCGTPSFIPEKPGVFILSNCFGSFFGCFFGTSMDGVGSIKPLTLGSNLETKSLREDLTQQLQETRQQNSDDISNIVNFKASITSIKSDSVGIITEFAIIVEPKSNLNNSSLTAQIQSNQQIYFDNDQNFQNLGDIKAFQNKQFTCILVFKKGAFSPAQKIFFSLQGLIQEQGKNTSYRSEISLFLPLPSFLTFSTIPKNVVANSVFQVKVQLSRQITSLAAFLQQKQFSEQLLQQLRDNPQNGLCIQQLNGGAVAIHQENQSCVLISTNLFETVFAAINFLESYGVDYSLSYDQQNVVEYYEKLVSQQGSNQAQSKAVQQVLGKQLDQFILGNESVSKLLFDQSQPNVFVRPPASGFLDCADFLAQQLTYTQLMCSKVQLCQSQDDNYILKLIAFIQSIYALKQIKSEEELDDFFVSSKADLEKIVASKTGLKNSSGSQLIQKFLMN